MIFLAADHQGRAILEDVASFLSSEKLEFEETGKEFYSLEDDYPDFATSAVARLLEAWQSGDTQAKAILLCGSGQGMAIAANRFRGIRAGLCWDISETELSRSDDDINVLCLPVRLFKEDGNNMDSWKDIIKAFLETEFKKVPRYSRRIEKLDLLP